MADFKNYDPKLHKIVAFGHEVMAPAAGTFVDVERDEDTFTTKTGAHGDTIFQRKHNRNGKATIRVLASSPTNVVFSAVFAASEVGATADAGQGTFMIKDLNGTTLLESRAARIAKPPKYEIGDEAPDREWPIILFEVRVLIGGALV